MFYEDAKQLERDLDSFSHGDDEKYNLTRIDAQFIAKCINFTLKFGNYQEIKLESGEQ